jgi:MoxR-like ATPase
VIDFRERLAAEIGKVVVGQEAAVDDLLTALLVGGHVLLEGVPGVAKTLLANATARALGLEFRRVQFTADMLPSDLTGTMTLRGGELVFRAGPVFTEVLLADEINRTPPKTQAALLEAMQEGQVTIEGTARPLGDVFLVIATQNPIEFEGTYPLPEAQLDRFMFMIIVGYPTAEEELAIMKATTGGQNVELKPTLSGEDIIALQDIVRRIPVGDHVFRYAAALARATRPNEGEAPDFVRECISWGAGPRASQYLILGAKARAALYGRNYASTEDVAAIALPVLRHRIVTNFNAEAEGMTSDKIVQMLIDRTPRPNDPVRK